MRILLTGATGFIGRKLTLRLFRDGHNLVLLSRDPERASKETDIPCEWFRCDLMRASPSPEALEGVDAVIHLAGESVATGRWTGARKKAIRDSRVMGTRNLVRAIQKPIVFLSTSAIGYYGDRGDEALSEDTPPGPDFLSKVCQEWEREALQAKSARRIAIMRLGVVLGENGGALNEMLTPFSLGLGTSLGSGSQWMSWVHIDDVVEAFCFALKNEQVIGPVNVVSPEPLRNAEFTQVLASALKKPALLSAPSALIRFALGEKAVIILGSARVLPAQLQKAGFTFLHPHLKDALTDILKDFPNRVFEATQFMNRPVAEVFEFFSEARNLEEITPPWLNFRVVAQTEGPIREGTKIEYRLRVHGWSMGWKSEIAQWRSGEVFADKQTQGPYASWYHTHRFESVRGGTLMRDRVSYRLPWGRMGSWVAGKFVAKDIRGIFSFRKAKIVERFK